MNVTAAREDTDKPTFFFTTVKLTKKKKNTTSWTWHRRTLWLQWRRPSSLAIGGRDERCKWYADVTLAT